MVAEGVFFHERKGPKIVRPLISILINLSLTQIRILSLVIKLWSWPTTMRSLKNTGTQNDFQQLLRHIYFSGHRQPSTGHCRNLHRACDEGCLIILNKCLWENSLPHVCPYRQDVGSGTTSQSSRMKLKWTQSSQACLSQSLQWPMVVWALGF